jgi:propanediol utilization protein
MTNGTLGLGNISLSSCDDNVNVSPKSEFDGSTFTLASVTLSGVNSACDGSKLVLYIPIKASGTLKGSSGAYNNSDLIVCTIDEVAVSGGVITVSDSTATCKVKRTTSTITLEDVNAEDVGGNIGLTMSN